MIDTQEWHAWVKWVLNTVWLAQFEWRKIIWLFDFDEAYESFKTLKTENGWWPIEWTEESWLFRKKDWVLHPCFYALLLPVPSSRAAIASKDFEQRSSLEVEYLFEDSILQTLFPNPERKRVPWGELIKTWQKSLFAGRVNSLDKSAFSNFRVLFNKIHSVFELPEINI